MEFLLCVLGAVMVVEGIPYFAMPQRVKAVMREILGMPDSSLRILGLALMAGGLVLVWLARR
ncbi:MAG: DUF2065 domain-containing protein [Proteobacteria bacterium]|nr:DUF2065 domain-containing protein [Pseudomonadota bacterium]